VAWVGSLICLSARQGGQNGAESVSDRAGRRGTKRGNAIFSRQHSGDLVTGQVHPTNFKVTREMLLILSIVLHEEFEMLGLPSDLSKL
jgi:hypothetical protein